MMVVTDGAVSNPGWRGSHKKRQGTWERPGTEPDPPVSHLDLQDGLAAKNARKHRKRGLDRIHRIYRVAKGRKRWLEQGHGETDVLSLTPEP